MRINSCDTKQGRKDRGTAWSARYELAKAEPFPGAATYFHAAGVKSK
jgi:hypothetical protein